MYITDTIAALSTPPGFGGISVLRISGPESFKTLKTVFKPSHPIKNWESHKLYLGWIHDECDKRIDQVMVSWMKGPQSYTAEDVIEISCHGSPVIAQKILRLLFQSGIRPADPGEFTKRAFLNGRMDLNQAESVMELISSRSEKAAELSLQIIQGEFSKQIKSVQKELVELLAYIEAFLDFPDEDLPDQDQKSIKNRFENLIKIVQQFKDQSNASQHLREGIEIVILGPSNAGKSSLFNAILGQERAIVSQHAGTTRDFIDAEVIHDGLLLRFVDTAGLRYGAHEIEQIGQLRGMEKGKSADLILFVIDGTLESDPHVDQSWNSLSKSVKILIKNKKDLKGYKSNRSHSFAGAYKTFEISSQSGDGVFHLVEYIIEYFKNNESKVDDKVIFNTRQRNEVENIHNSLNEAFQAFDQGLSHEFVSSDLRIGLNSLESLTGENLNESVIDEIFSTFCLGK